MKLRTCNSLGNFLGSAPFIFSLLFDICNLFSSCRTCQCFGDNFRRKNPYFMYSLRRNSVFDISLLEENKSMIIYICVKACSFFKKSFYKICSLDNNLNNNLPKIVHKTVKIWTSIIYEMRRKKPVGMLTLRYAQTGQTDDSLTLLILFLRELLY